LNIQIYSSSSIGGNFNPQGASSFNSPGTGYNNPGSGYSNPGSGYNNPGSGFNNTGNGGYSTVSNAGFGGQQGSYNNPVASRAPYNAPQGDSSDMFSRRSPGMGAPMRQVQSGGGYRGPSNSGPPPGGRPGPNYGQPVPSGNYG